MAGKFIGYIRMKNIMGMCCYWEIISTRMVRVTLLHTRLHHTTPLLIIFHNRIPFSGLFLTWYAENQVSLLFIPVQLTSITLIGRIQKEIRSTQWDNLYMCQVE